MLKKEHKGGFHYHLPWIFFVRALTLWLVLGLGGSGFLAATESAQGAISGSGEELAKDNGLRKTPKKVQIAVFDSGKGSSHESKVTALLKRALKDCADCEYRAYPIYNWSGELSVGRFLSALTRAKEFADILHFSWNIERSPKTADIEEMLQKMAKQGKIIVAAAGESTKHGRKILKLSETVMGKVPGVFLIGELSPRGWLSLQSNYGDELFTALPAPPGMRGSSFSSVAFTGKLAQVLGKYKPDYLLQKIRINRQKSTTLWPRLDRLFEAI